MSSDRIVRKTGVHLSQRFTRRSILGRTATAVAAMGAAGAGYSISTEDAEASHLPCSGRLSETCNNLLGSNSCPWYTCKDGYWPVSSSLCPSGTTYWQDCCTSSERCRDQLGGCHCHGDSPTCCNDCNYCINCCGKVRCRRWFC